MIGFADGPAERKAVEAEVAMGDRAIIGTPEEIAAAIAGYGPLGFDEFILPDFWYVDDIGRKRDLYERFITEVVPLVG